MGMCFFIGNKYNLNFRDINFDVFGFIGFVLRGYVIELSRLRILLNKTREEYVTKSDSNQVLSQIMSKFDRIEEKLDRLVERK